MVLDGSAVIVVLDTSRARERFGFIAEMPFEEGLRRTIDWYRAARSAAG